MGAEGKFEKKKQHSMQRRISETLLHLSVFVKFQQCAVVEKQSL